MLKNDNENIPVDHQEESIKALRIFYNIDISHKEEVEKALTYLSDKKKSWLANIPIVLLVDVNFSCGLGAEIRHERNLWFRCKDPEGESLFILIDVWWELQKDKRYLGKLRHPRTGKYLPEIYRHNTLESAKYFFPGWFKRTSEGTRKYSAPSHRPFTMHSSN